MDNWSPSPRAVLRPSNTTFGTGLRIVLGPLPTWGPKYDLGYACELNLEQGTVGKLETSAFQRHLGRGPTLALTNGRPGPSKYAVPFGGACWQYELGRACELNRRAGTVYEELISLFLRFKDM